MNMLRSIAIALVCLSFGFGFAGCRKTPALHRPTPEDCAKRPKDENTCNACASLPTCGWCGQPAEGRENCQPQGDTSEKPDGCTDDWAVNSSDCPAPPPANDDGIE